MGTGVGEAMLIGAATGAGTSALSGQDPLKGAMFGALGGAIMPGIGQALGGQAAGTITSAVPGATMNVVPSAAQSALQTALPELGVNAATSAASSSTVPSAFQSALSDLGVTSTAEKLAASNAAGTIVTPQTGLTDIFKSTAGGPGFGERVGNYIVQNPGMAASSGAGLSNMLLNRPDLNLPGEDKYKGPLSRFRYDPDFYNPAFAGGGIADLPVSKMYAEGGDLGGYSDGGRMLKGPGDGMSDSIPARIGSRQPARLADGEFVVPADVVSHLGNGSTDAGAKQLYAMMDKVRKARTGNKKQGREINPRKYVPA